MPALNDSQIFYAGEFRHSIDEKNRVTIPSRWRRGEAQEFIILPDAHHKCLLVMSPEEFVRMSAKVESDDTIPPAHRRVVLRHLHSRAQHGSADKQGRLVLPEELCRQCDLRGEVALLGGNGRFEIWNAKRWENAQEEEMSTYQHVANALGL